MLKREILPHTKAIAILGIDSGSTTTKAALVAEDGTLLYSYYSGNNGNPLQTIIDAVKDIYKKLPSDAHDCTFMFNRLW